MVELNSLRSAAARVAAKANLRDVRLFQVSAEVERLPEQPGGLSYTLDSKVEVQHVTDGPAIIVDGTYDLAVTVAAADDREPPEEGADDRVATIRFQLAALYALKAPGDRESWDFDDEELDAFGQTTGMLTLHPYAREFIASTTSRMGLPTLHVGTAHIFLDKHDGE